MYDASNPLPVGIVGCGGRGLGLGRELRETGLGAVRALCDLGDQRLKIAKETFPGAAVTQDPHELARRDDVRALFIATPDDTHVDLALSLKPYRKHLLVEKPLAVSTKDCDRLVRGFSGEDGIVRMVGLCMRYNNLTRRIHDLVSGGLIGEVLAAHCMDNVSVGGDYYFHRWMSRKKHVVGLLLQKGCHSLDFISWILGSRALKVHAFGGLDYYGGEEPAGKRCRDCGEFEDCTERMDRVVKYDYIREEIRAPDECAYSVEVDVNDNAVVNVLYESGAKLSYTECHFTPDYVREFQFIGTRGRIRAWTSLHGQHEVELTFRHRRQKKIFETIEMDPGAHGGGDRAMLVEFVNAINEKRAPLTDFSAGRECAAIALGAERSIESGEIVEIPNVDGSKRSAVRRKGRSRELSRKALLDRSPLFGA